MPDGSYQMTLSPGCRYPIKPSRRRMPVVRSVVVVVQSSMIASAFPVLGEWWVTRNCVCIDCHEKVPVTECFHAGWTRGPTYGDTPPNALPWPWQSTCPKMYAALRSALSTADRFGGSLGIGSNPQPGEGSDQRKTRTFPPLIECSGSGVKTDPLKCLSPKDHQDFKQVGARRGVARATPLQDRIFRSHAVSLAGHSPSLANT